MPPGNNFNTPETGDDDSKERSQTTYLLNLARQNFTEIFTTSDQEPYVTIKMADHVETHPIESRAVLRWLQKLHAVNNWGVIATEHTLQRVVEQLKADAAFSGAIHDVTIRIAHFHNSIYIDTGWEDWSIISIGATGWEIIEYSECPAKFRRSRAFGKLPEPKSGGSVDALREFVNFPNDDDWIMFKSILVAAYLPSGGFPVVTIHGEQGTAKSTIARVFKRLIDPSTTDLRSAPRTERDIFVAADREFLLSFENVSQISQQMSDAFCKLSTGATFATRQLYSDKEEVLLTAKRLVILNGIGHLISRQDLQDRQIDLELPPISDANRTTESKLWSMIESVLPEVFGAILVAISDGLRKFRTIRLEKAPRMADFATWVVACSEALGFDAQEFLDLYKSRRVEALNLSAESNDFISAVIDYVQESYEVRCTATELLTLIGDPPEGRSRWWPRGGKSVSNALERHAASLRAAGIQFERLPRSAGRREILLTNTGITPN